LDRTKHVHVMLPFDEWVRLKKRLADEDKRVTHFVRELILSELKESRPIGATTK